jgi:hypothetical protein
MEGWHFAEKKEEDLDPQHSTIIRTYVVVDLASRKQFKSAKICRSYFEKSRTEMCSGSTEL